MPPAGTDASYSEDHSYPLGERGREKDTVKEREKRDIHVYTCVASTLHLARESVDYYGLDKWLRALKLSPYFMK